MKNDNSQSNFISGIHNYCDRWCERCEFAARCSVSAEESDWTDEELDIGNVAFVRKLSGIFAETKQMLIDKAEELGIDPYALSDEEFAEIRQREKAFVDNHELVKLGENYWRSAREILESDGWLSRSPEEDETVADVLSVLNWYLFFISAKLHRGLRGLLDDDGYEDTEQMHDSQSDANGSIKVGLIAIERSLLAWSYLLEPGNSDRVQPMIELLERIKLLTEELFPHARDFIRPGFDEIEVVM